jgi:hypothetical protein
MIAPAFIESGLMASVAAMYPSIGTVKVPPTTQSAFGDIDRTTPASWATLAGASAIPCRVSPAGGSGPGATENRTPIMTQGISSFDISLSGLYPAITNAMVFVCAGQYYNILGTGSDGCGIHTVLSAEIRSV